MIEIINRVTKQRLLEAIHENNVGLVSRWGCSEFSFRDVGENATCADLIKTVGNNLRSDAFYDGMSGEEFINLFNDGYLNSVQGRFMDYKVNNIDQSVQEPTAIVTEDGERLDLLGGMFYTYTEDGFNFAEPCALSFENPENYTFACWNFFKHDGKFYCTTPAGKNNVPVGILMWEEKAGNVWGETATTKVFTNPKVVYPYDGSDNGNFGNTFVIKKGNTWYMLIEISGLSDPQHLGYMIYLASCSTMDGTYSLVQSAPVIENHEHGQTIATNSAGNPDIAMLCGGIPYTYNGKYYLMYHHMIHDSSKSYSYLYRCDSTDLIHWNVEGPILTGRIAPSSQKLTNADATWCEFKGRSYIFYMNNANKYLDPTVQDPPTINAVIDFRPMFELFSLKP